MIGQTQPLLAIGAPYIQELNANHGHCIFPGEY